MDNVNQNFSGFPNEAQNINNFIHTAQEYQYLNMENAAQFENWTKNLEKPLQNEIEILRYCQIMKEKTQLDDNPSLFDPEDEAEKIRSGYYINIHESLNIFKQFHDGEENPFIKLHKESLEFIKDLRTQAPGILEELQKHWPSENVSFQDFSNSDSDSDKLEIDIGSEISLLNVSDYEIDDSDPKDEENAAIIEETIKKTEKRMKNKRRFNFSVVEPKQVKLKIVKRQKTSSVLKKKPRKMSPKTTKKCNKSTKNKSNASTSKKTLKTPEKSVLKLPLSPILPSAAFEPNPTSQEFQLFDEKKSLEYFETQFMKDIFEENGRTIYPILTNCNFEGILYDFEDELLNNEIIKKEIFSRANFWRKS